MVDISSVNNALAAYGATANRTVDAISKQDSEVKTAGETFQSLLKGAVNETVELQEKSEEMSMKAIAGQANMEDVVSAVTNAEMALETIVAVRDKVISSYQEIMRMAI
jgi:flagellar hook-basal body complex protein FliE